MRSIDKLVSTIYRKPSKNNRDLHFKCNHPPQVRGA